MSTFENQKYPHAGGLKMKFPGRGTEIHSHDCSEIYHELMKNLGTLDDSYNESSITLTKFLRGSTVICFTYAMNNINTSYSSFATEPGLLSVSLKFSTPIEEPMSVVFFPLIDSNTFLHPDTTVISTS